MTGMARGTPYEVQENHIVHCRTATDIGEEGKNQDTVLGHDIYLNHAVWLEQHAAETTTAREMLLHPLCLSLSTGEKGFNDVSERTNRTYVK